MQFNKDKFRNLIKRYNMNNFCKEFELTEKLLQGYQVQAKTQEK